MSVNLGSAVGAIELKATGVTKGAADAIKAIKSIDSQTSGVGKGLDQISDKGAKAGQGVAKGAEQGTAALKKLSDTSRDVTGSLDKISATATVVGGALAAGLAGAAKGAADLQTSIAKISTIRPDINVSQVGDDIQAMSGRVAQSTAQLAQSLYNVFSSVDVSQSEALKLTEGFAKGAVTAQTDAETFGTAILGVMNAYKLSVGDAGHVSDVFFNTINKGVIDGGQLASVLGNVSQSAKNAGVNFDTLGALIAGVTKEGGDASVNVNNLNNVLQKIVTEDVQTGLQAMGIATKDANGNFRDILGVLADLDAALGKLSQGDRAAALQKLFPDAQARTGIQTLLSQLQFINTAAQDNAKAVGVTSDAYAKMGATAAAQATILKSTLLNTLADLGEIALPNLLSIATKIQALVKAFDSLSPSTKSAVVGAAELAAAFLLIGAVGVKAVTAAIELGTALGTVGKGAAEAAVKLYTLASSLTAVQVASVAGPLLIAIGLAAAGTAITMDNMATGTKKAADALGGDLGGAIAKIDVSKLDAIQAFLTGINVAAEKAGKSTTEFAKTQGIDELRAQIKSAGEEFAKLQREGKGNTDEAATIRAVIQALFDEIAARETLIKTGQAQQQQLAALNAQYDGTQVPGDKIATGVNAGAAALAQLVAAAGPARDAIGSVADETDRLLTKFQQTEQSKLAERLTAIGAAMSQVQSATGPLTNELSALQAKQAQGIPLTQQEASLLQQIPGYLGEAASATSGLAAAQAQAAIDAINAAGGISAMGGQFTGATGQAAGLSGEINHLNGAILALQTNMSELGTENGRLGAEYSALQERVDALQQKVKEGGKLTGEESSELATLLAAQKKIADQRGENAAKIREEILAEEGLIQKRKEAAKAIEDANAADLKAKSDPFNSREDHRGQAPVIATPSPATQVAQALQDFTPPPVPVNLEPAVDNASLAAVRQVLGQPVEVPITVSPQLQKQGFDSATAEALGIIGGKGNASTITVTADTGAATSALQAVQDRLIAINDTPTQATIAAIDNASAVAQTVTGNVKAIPEIHATELTAVDNASGVVLGLIETINSVPSTLQVTASVDTSAAIAAINDLRAYMPSSPSEKGAFRTLPDWGSVFKSLAPAGEEAVDTLQTTTVKMARAIGEGIDGVMAESAKSAAELATTVAGAVNGTADALDRVRAFRAPNPGQFERFRAAMLPVLDAFAEDGAARGAEAAKGASEWAESAQKVFASVGTGVDALVKLRNFVRPTDQAVRDFRDVSQFVINTISRVAADSDADLTEAGAKWAEAAGKVFASVGTGVDALTKLSTFKRPADKAATDFRDISQFVVNLLAQVAADIEDQALPKAADWAETASKIFAALSSGVDALTKLHDFERPTDQAVESFRDVAQYVVNLLAQVAADIEDQALPKASAWADTAGKIFAALSSGVDALSKVEGFERPTDQAMQSLVDATQFAVNAIARVAAATDAEMVQAAATYSEAAGKVVSLIGSGSSTLGKLAEDEFTPPSRETLDRIAIATREAVLAVARAAQDVDTDLVAEAGKYADGASKSVGLIGSGVGAFAQLSTFIAPTKAQIDGLVAATVETIRLIAEAASRIDKDAVKAAGDYGDAGQKAIGAVGATISAFGNLKDFVAPSKEGIDGVVEVTRYATQRLAEIAQGFDPATLQRLSVFGSGVNSGLGAIKAALEIGKSFQDDKRVTPADAIGTALNEFTAGLAPLDQLLAVSQQYLNKGNAIGANIAQAYAAIATGLPGFDPQAGAGGEVTGAVTQTIVHHFDGGIDFRFLGENGEWIVSSLRADDAALNGTADLLAGKLAPIFAQALGA